MGLVFFEAVWIGLDHTTIFEEDQAGLLRRHPEHKRFSFREQFPKTPHCGGGVDRRVAFGIPEVLGCITRDTAYPVDDPFRCEPMLVSGTASLLDFFSEPARAQIALDS